MSQTSLIKKMTAVLALACIVALVAVLVWLFKPQELNNPTPKQTETDKTFNPVYDENKQQSQITEVDVSSNTINKSADIVNTKENDNAAINLKESVPAEINPETGLPFEKNDPEKLAHRKATMLSLAEIIQATSLGEEADSKKTLEVATEMVEIYKDGYLLKNDAFNTLSFLKQTQPDIASDIDRLLAQLD